MRVFNINMTDSGSESNESISEDDFHSDDDFDHSITNTAGSETNTNTENTYETDATVTPSSSDTESIETSGSESKEETPSKVSSSKENVDDLDYISFSEDETELTTKSDDESQSRSESKDDTSFKQKLLDTGAAVVNATGKAGATVGKLIWGDAEKAKIEKLKKELELATDRTKKLPLSVLKKELTADDYTLYEELSNQIAKEVVTNITALHEKDMEQIGELDSKLKKVRKSVKTYEKLFRELVEKYKTPEKRISKIEAEIKKLNGTDDSLATQLLSTMKMITGVGLVGGAAYGGYQLANGAGIANTLYNGARYVANAAGYGTPAAPLATDQVRQPYQQPYPFAVPQPQYVPSQQPYPFVVPQPQYVPAPQQYPVRVPQPPYAPSQSSPQPTSENTKPIPVPAYEEPPKPTTTQPRNPSINLTNFTQPFVYEQNENVHNQGVNKPNYSN